MPSSRIPPISDVGKFQKLIDNDGEQDTQCDRRRGASATPIFFCLSGRSRQTMAMTTALSPDRSRSSHEICNNWNRNGQAGPSFRVRVERRSKGDARGAWEDTGERLPFWPGKTAFLRHVDEYGGRTQIFSDLHKVALQT